MKIFIYLTILITILLGASIVQAEFGTSRLYILVPEGCFPPSSGDWNISQTASVLCQDKYIVLNGSLTIYGLLTFKNVTLLINNSINGEHNITVYSIGTFSVQDKDNNQSTTVDASNITASNTTNKFDIIVQNGAVFEFLNSFLSYAGWQQADSGLIIYSNNARVWNSTLSNNFIGVYVSGANNFTIANSTISSSISSDIVFNSTSYNNSIVNTNFNKSKLTVLDTSNATIKWFLDVNVTDNASSPLSAASVTITDSKSTQIFSGTTSSNGGIPTQLVTEYIANNTTNNFFTPHTVSGSKSGYDANSSSVNVSNTTSFRLILTPSSPAPPPPTGGGGVIIQYPTTPLVLDTSVHIAPGSEQVVPGQRVYAEITIERGGGPPGTINTNLRYSMLNPDGIVVDRKTTTVAVENLRRDIYYLTVPPNSKLGVYTFEAYVSYDNASDTSEDTFQVVQTAPEAFLHLDFIDVPIFFTNQKGKITATFKNTLTDASVDYNATLYLPPGVEVEPASISGVIGPRSSEFIQFNVIPRIFGVYTGFLNIKYDDRGLTKDFLIFILPSYLLIIPIIILMLVFTVFYRRREKKKAKGKERIEHIRRLVGR